MIDLGTLDQVLRETYLPAVREALNTENPILRSMQEMSTFRGRINRKARRLRTIFSRPWVRRIWVDTYETWDEWDYSGYNGDGDWG